MVGITVSLEVKTQSGTDPFGKPLYKTTEKDIDDVLGGEPSTEDITNTMAMYGKRIAYTLAIPKGNEDSWEDTIVILPAPFSGRYHTIGAPTAGIEANIPLRWNKKVHLERFEG